MDPESKRRLELISKRKKATSSEAGRSICIRTGGPSLTPASSRLEVASQAMAVVVVLTQMTLVED